MADHVEVDHDIDRPSIPGGQIGDRLAAEQALLLTAECGEHDAALQTDAGEDARHLQHHSNSAAVVVGPGSRRARRFRDGVVMAADQDKSLIEPLGYADHAVADRSARQSILDESHAAGVVTETMNCCLIKSRAWTSVGESDQRVGNAVSAFSVSVRRALSILPRTASMPASFFLLLED